MLLLVPAHPGCPGQIPQGRKTVVCVCVCICDFLLVFHSEFGYEWNGCQCHVTNHENEQNYNPQETQEEEHEVSMIIFIYHRKWQHTV